MSWGFTSDHVPGRLNGGTRVERRAGWWWLATAAWVAWWNAERLHSACGDIPPTEFEAAYHHRLQAAPEAA